MVLFALIAVASAAPRGASALKSITKCTDSGVRSAVTAGGEYVFQCDPGGAIQLDSPLTVSGSVSLDATSREVVLSNPRGRVFNVNGGSLKLIGLAMHGVGHGGSGADGASGTEGADGANGPTLPCVPGLPGAAGDGGDGGDGKAGKHGGVAQGGTLYVAPGASVWLYRDEVRGIARGGDGGDGGAGGDGGWGGDGGFLQGSCGPEHIDGGSGGDAGHGSTGGDAGDAEGGAVYVAPGATFDAIDTQFVDTRARGGDGGSGGDGGEGGWRGDGGSGGNTGNAGDYSGSGGRGSAGGDAGGARGGAIYNLGTVNLWDSDFLGLPPILYEDASGGSGGDGGRGGNGGNGQGRLDPPVGTGGDGGSGGAGGPAIGGAIYNAGELNLIRTEFWYVAAGRSGEVARGGNGGQGGDSPVGGAGPTVTGDGGDGGDGGSAAFASIAGPIATADCVGLNSSQLDAGIAGEGGAPGSQEELFGPPDGVFGFDGNGGAAGTLNPSGLASPPCPGMVIDEIFLSENGDPAAQFVELEDPVDEPFPDSGAPYKLVVYDSTGTVAGEQQISIQLLQGRDNTERLLVSTAAADSALGVAGDESLRVPLPPVGQACFTRGSGKEQLGCIAWGCVSSLANPDTLLVAAPPDGKSTQAIGLAQPTPGTDNFFSLDAPRCAAVEPEPAEPEPAGPSPVGGGGSAPPAPTDAAQPHPRGASGVAIRASALERCIAGAKRAFERSTGKAKAIADRAARRRAQQEATKKYQRATKRCRAKFP